MKIQNTEVTISVLLEIILTFLKYKIEEFVVRPIKFLWKVIKSFRIICLWHFAKYFLIVCICSAGVVLAGYILYWLIRVFGFAVRHFPNQWWQNYCDISDLGVGIVTLFFLLVLTLISYCLYFITNTVIKVISSNWRRASRDVIRKRALKENR